MTADHAPDLSAMLLFQTLEPSELSSVSALASEARFQKGQVILSESIPAMNIYIIIEGCVSVQKGTEEGREVLAILERGDHFGELAMLDRGPASAAVMAEDDTFLVVIPHDALVELMRRELVIANKILTQMVNMLAQRLRRADKSLVFARSLVEKYRTLA